MMRAKIKFVAALVAVVALGVGFAWAQQDVPADAPPAPASVVVLDTFGIWRMHCTLAPPVLVSGETVSLNYTSKRREYTWLNFKTPGPAQGWMKSNFDDRFWGRGPVGLAVKTALLSKVCLRGKFTVTNPTDVKKLRLSVSYRGGIIVYLNGKELRREHIAKGKSVAEGLAGEERNISDLSIPKKLLRKGMNVIGIEIVRAPHAQASDENVYEANGCEIRNVRLTSSGVSGLIPNAVRPQGVQIWNADAVTGDFDLDFGDQAEGLRPVKIICARNGMFSGKVVVGSTKPIRGLKVTPGTITGTGGTIPASNVHIRYGIPWGEQILHGGGRLNRTSAYPVVANLLGALAEEPLDEFSVMRAGKRWPVTDVWYGLPRSVPGQPKPVSGAVVPIWITVKVPADVKAGTYTGNVKIEMSGEKSVTAPLELHVVDYVLPDTQDYRTFVDIIQCPDTLAVEYKVPLWSEEHWKMIAHSLKLIGQTGGRTLYVPLLAHTNLGNEESMVRWVRKGDKFEYDFSIMERYLSVAEKNMGTPKLLVFNVWEVYMLSKEVTGKQRTRRRWHITHMNKIGAEYGSGPIVTMFDPATQETKIGRLPAHFDAEASKPLWKPLFDELRKRLKKRGLEKTMMLGMIHDSWPSKEEVAFFHDIAPGVPWVMQSHEGHAVNKLLYDIAPIGYQAVVYKVKFSTEGTGLHGWKRKDLVAQFSRRFLVDRDPNTLWRHYVEMSIAGDVRGRGRVGGDYWKLTKNKRGKRSGRSHERYPESTWRNLYIPSTLLAPGPKGPAATSRMEVFREGVQECEARIVIERALYDETLRDKLGGNLAKRCEEYLHARHMMMFLSRSNLQLYQRRPEAKKHKEYYAYGWGAGRQITGHNWYLCSNWQTRTAKLYSLAGEVTRKLNGK